MTHKGLEFLSNTRVRAAAEFLWFTSEKYHKSTPSIVPYDYDDVEGACVQWGGDLICFILPEESSIMIECDMMGYNTETYQFPEQSTQLEILLKRV